MHFPARHRARLATALSCAFLLGCSDAGPTAARTDAPSPTRTPTADTQAQQAALVIVTRSVAAALTDGALRQLFLENLRDSPYRQHRLNVGSYLRGADGGRISAAAARSAQMRPDSFVALLRQLPELEISVPLASDRINWTGTSDAVVVGTLARRADLIRLPSVTGYSTRDGSAVNVPIGISLSYPLIAIVPAEAPLVQAPEAARRGPRNGQPTVSTSDEEFATIQMEGDTGSCDSSTAIVECSTENGGSAGPPPPPAGLRLPSQRTYECYVSAGTPGDSDTDGLLDDCEAELAFAFRPFMQYTRYEHDQGREPYWAVRRSRSSSNVVKVFYLLSYYLDSGADFAYSSVGEHLGDNEFVVFSLSYWGGYWRLDSAFLSAHYDKWGWDSSSTRAYDVFSYPDGTFRGRPKIWAAQGKHANYHSQSKCDEGANYYDTCDHPDPNLNEINAEPAWNIGNNEDGGTRLIDCIGSRAMFPQPGTECFWTGDSFRGWKTQSGTAAGSYRGPLGDFDF